MPRNNVSIRPFSFILSLVSLFVVVVVTTLGILSWSSGLRGYNSAVRASQLQRASSPANDKPKYSTLSPGAIVDSKGNVTCDPNAASSTDYVVTFTRPGSNTVETLVCKSK